MRVVHLLLVLLAAAGSVEAQKIAFVDLEKVLENHREVKKAIEEAGRTRDERMERLRQRMEELRTLQEDLSMLRKGSPQWLEQTKRIQIEGATLDLDRRLVLIEYNLELVKRVKVIQQKTMEVVEKLAKERGYMAVSVYSPHEHDAAEFQAYMRRLGTLGFIWHDRTHDLTEELLRQVR